MTIIYCSVWVGRKKLDVDTNLIHPPRAGKIWVENDWTESGIVDRIVERGVPTTAIVLAFHPPEMRMYTEFALACSLIEGKRPTPK
jgi:hypothetical protein